MFKTVALKYFSVGSSPFGQREWKTFIAVIAGPAV